MTTRDQIKEGNFYVTNFKPPINRAGSFQTGSLLAVKVILLSCVPTLAFVDVYYVTITPLYLRGLGESLEWPIGYTKQQLRLDQKQQLVRLEDINPDPELLARIMKEQQLEFPEG